MRRSNFLRTVPKALSSKLLGPSSILILAVVFSNMLRIVSAVVLTRILGPRELGLSAIIQSIFFTLAMISDVGFQAFVVRHADGDDRRFLDVIWSIQFVRGIALWLMGICIGGFLYMTGPNPSLGLLLGCAALTFAIEGTVSPSLFTALRTGAVRLLSLIDVIVLTLQFIATLIAALVFHNAWAIIIGMILGSFVRAALSFTLFANGKRRFRYDPTIGRDLWTFSRSIAPSSILTLVIAQVDKLLLASYLNVAAFGVYATAANLAAAPQALAHSYANRIIYPALARAWRDEPQNMQVEYYARRGIVFYGFLLCAGILIGSAPAIVDLLFDARYRQAGTFLRLLAIPTAMILITRALSECIVATGRPSIGLEMNIGRIAWLAIGGPIAFFNGGVLAFLAVLASVEVPAYFCGIYRLRQLGLLRRRMEALAFIVILIGAVVGIGIDYGYFAIGKSILEAAVHALKTSIG